MKKYKFMVLILLLIIFGVAGLMYCVNVFNNKGLNSGIATSQEEYNQEQINSLKLKPDITEKKNYVISNVFIINYKTQTQIRFRIAYPIPYMKENIFKYTDFTIKDSLGKEYNHKAAAYPETCMGLNGINFTLVFDGNDYMPESGEDLFFVIKSSKENDLYCKFKIKIPKTE